MSLVSSKGVSTARSSTVGEIGEFALIERLAKILKNSAPLTAGDSSITADYLGIGDDCAVLPFPAANLLWTTDTLVENIHFDRKFCPPEDLGWRTLAVSLSDIAAMGGFPKAALVSVAVPSALPLEWIEGVYRGIDEISRQFGVAIVGGNCTSATEISLSSTVLGVTCAASTLLRSGAKVGDDLWVSGIVGAAGAGLRALKAGVAVGNSQTAAAIRRHLAPMPRVELGQALAGKRLATAAIDISDGLLQDACHIAERSNVGVELWLEKLPLMEQASRELREVALAAVAGDDYELLFTASPTHRGDIEGLGLCQLTRIGAVRSAEAKPGVAIKLQSGVRAGVESFLADQGLGGGFEHFKQARRRID